MSARAKTYDRAERFPLIMLVSRMEFRRGQEERGWHEGDAFQIVWWWRAWRLRFVGAWPSRGVPIYRWTLRLGPLEVRRWGP